MTPPPSRVVLVDDMPDVRRLVATALRLRGGFEVVGEAGDGRAAVEVVARTRPDVVVLDLGLPALRDGDLLTALREAAPDAKIAVFTGRSGEDDVRGRVEGYVVKDDDVATLLDLLEDLGPTDRQVAVLALPPDPESTRAARAYLTYHATRWGYVGDLYEAELAVGELVNNALTHAAPPFSLRLGMSDDALHVEVLDATPTAPDLVGREEEERGWRGLTYVSLLAQAWGVTPLEPGKAVWARLAPGPAASRD